MPCRGADAAGFRTAL